MNLIQTLDAKMSLFAKLRLFAKQTLDPKLTLFAKKIRVIYATRIARINTKGIGGFYATGITRANGKWIGVSFTTGIARINTKGLAMLLVIACSTLGLSAQNYDESKVPVYTLPDPLISENGQAISNTSEWLTIRRPEILRLFQNNVYGQMPKAYDSLTYNILNQDGSAMGGKALLKEIELKIWRKQQAVTIGITVFVPNGTKTPPGLFILLNNRGKDNTDPSRKNISPFWPAELVIDSGYAVAAFQVSDLAPDNKEHYPEGVLRLFPDQLKRPDGMKAIGAWAWGASRVLDYFETDASVNARQVFLVGHSRGGKAALWAGANDQRFTIVFSNCSGNTGAALSKRQFGETVKRINSSFPYWFADNYRRFNDNVDSLPLDQHMLIASIAPRPVYVTSATKDLWADPKGSFLALRNAQPVYELFKKKVSLGDEMPAPNKPIIQSALGYHLREGEHNLTVFDWTHFIEFVRYHVKGK